MRSLVFRDKNFMPLGEEGPKNEVEKERHLLKIRYFAVIGLTNVKMVADRHRHAAYHNKHWRRAS